VLRERPSGELGEAAKKFGDTDKYAGEECTQEGPECAERTAQIHVLVVSAENGAKHHLLGECPVWTMRFWGLSLL
jgi:hypothetical protein